MCMCRTNVSVQRTDVRKKQCAFCAQHTTSTQNAQIMVSKNKHFFIWKNKASEKAQEASAHVHVLVGKNNITRIISRRRQQQHKTNKRLDIHIE